MANTVAHMSVCTNASACRYGRAGVKPVQTGCLLPAKVRSEKLSPIVFDLFNKKFGIMRQTALCKLHWREQPEHRSEQRPAEWPRSLSIISIETSFFFPECWSSSSESPPLLSQTSEF